MASAVSRVFAITESTALILTNFEDPRELFQAQRTSTGFRDTIKGSFKLLSIMGLTHSDGPVAEPAASPFLAPVNKFDVESFLRGHKCRFHDCQSDTAC